jgi:hypothetical protein
MVKVVVTKVGGSISSILPASINPIVAELIPALSLPAAILILGYTFLAFPLSLYEWKGNPSPDRRKAIPVNHPVIKALTTKEEMTNQELAHVMGVSKGEATKRRFEVSDHLVEERDGRTVRIRLAR